MGKVVAYMLTWTTYGTWLQGDKRRYVKEGVVLGENERLLRSNRDRLINEPVRLNKIQKAVVKECILQQAKKMGQKVYALAVWSNHVHVVVENSDKKIGSIMRQYKRAATDKLHELGAEGTIWTKGYDKRYCFCEEEIEARVKYVNGHK